MTLNTLYLFSNVKITRDYAVVQDMTPSDWFDYLTNKDSVQTGDPSPPSTVLNGMSVNYYRLPDVIRIEGNYDELRKATYGTLKTGQASGMPSFSLLHFWVDSVRLVKQGAYYPGLTPSQDVVELEISPDTWSNKFTDCELYDSYVARRHEDRWYRDHTDPDDPDAWVYHPRYFPNAADDVGGAYESDTVQDLTPPKKIDNVDYDLRFIVISILEVDSQQNLNGKQTLAIGASAVYGTHQEKLIYLDYANGIRLFCLDDIMDGTIFDALGVSAEFVQSITVTPYMGPLKATVKGAPTHLYIDDTMVEFSYYFDAHNNGVALGWITPKAGVGKLYSSVYAADSETVDPKAPQWVYNPMNPLLAQYSDRNEPMMFRSPARVRKVVTGMGGTITDVPDIDAFEDTYTSQNMIEVDQGMLMIYGGTDVEKANVKGNVGNVINASLPIFTSAWKSYQAIQKTGDDIAFNAQQVSTVIGTFTGAGAGMAGGAIAGASGGPAGAAAGAAVGVVGGIVGGVTRYWSNSENLRARRETIRNSPCVVKSGGSGLTAYIRDFIDVHYVVMKLEQVSLNKLRTQYYYYGYNVNMVMPGTIDTKIRKYFDYIETRGARIRGDVNADEAQQIAAAFDRGVRIYHGADGYKQIGAGMSMENPERAFLE